jgi:hypothetical protein
MQTKYLLTILAAFIVEFSFCQTQPAFSKWLFVKSDKALQYRFALAKQEGDLAQLLVEFRIKTDDPIHCQGPTCNGYIAYLSYEEPGTSNSNEIHLQFAKSFENPGRIYRLLFTIPIEFKTWPDGSRRFLSMENGIVYTTATNKEEQKAMYFYTCVDFVLQGQAQNHRCTRSYVAGKAIMVE